MSVTTFNIATDMPVSLGQAFITRKLSEYVEPVRKGSPRGSIIGMNRCKYAAALALAIYELDSAEVSRIVNVPTRLVSKWRTEPLFIGTTERLRNEFCERIELTAAEGMKVSEVCVDGGLYSATLKNLLIERYERAVTESDTVFVFLCWPMIRNMFRVQT